MRRLLLAHAALVDVLQGVDSLHRQLRQANARQVVLLREEPRLQGRVVFPFPFRILQGRLVDLPHGLEDGDTVRRSETKHPDVRPLSVPQR